MPTSMVCNDLDLFFVLIFSCFSLLDRAQTHPKYRMGSIPLIFTVADFAIAFLLGNSSSKHCNIYSYRE